jgi:formylmethanofuran dehydrogenase subunit C
MGCIACAALVLDGAGVTLTRRESSRLPVVAEGICPDRFVGLGLAEIAELPVLSGGREVPLGDVFDLDGPGAQNVIVTGDLSNVESIGQGMTMGRLTVSRDVGPHLGAGMSGGEIVAERAAGGSVGAGMSGGRIIVQGDAGQSVGSHMSGGLIVVVGDAGEGAGAGMVAGSIVVGGRLAGALGVGMERGTIVVFGEAPELPATFRPAGLGRPAFLRSQFPELEDAGLVKSSWFPEGEFRRYVSDIGGGGEMEVLVRDQS